MGEASASSTAGFYVTEEVENRIFGVAIPAPESEAEWKKIMKDPKKYAAKNVQKGAEVAWRRLSQDQRQLEVDQWLAQKVCAKANVPIPKLGL